MWGNKKQRINDLERELKVTQELVACQRVDLETAAQAHSKQQAAIVDEWEQQLRTSIETEREKADQRVTDAVQAEASNREAAISTLKSRHADEIQQMTEAVNELEKEIDAYNGRLVAADEALIHARAAADDARTQMLMAQTAPMLVHQGGLNFTCPALDIELSYDGTKAHPERWIMADTRSDMTVATEDWSIIDLLMADRRHERLVEAGVYVKTECESE